jgi:hypothetical protein
VKPSPDGVWRMSPASGSGYLTSLTSNNNIAQTTGETIMGRLVVVSNRIAPPDDKKSSAGGLAVGVLGALKAAGGLWFGWSGEISDEEKPLKKVTRGNITWASFALKEKDYEEYYSSSPMPCCGLRFTIVLTWSNSSVIL